MTTALAGFQSGILFSTQYFSIPQRDSFRHKLNVEVQPITFYVVFILLLVFLSYREKVEMIPLVDNEMLLYYKIIASSSGKNFSTALLPPDFLQVCNICNYISV